MLLIMDRVVQGKLGKNLLANVYPTMLPTCNPTRLGDWVSRAVWFSVCCLDRRHHAPRGDVYDPSIEAFAPHPKLTHSTALNRDPGRLILNVSIKCERRRDPPRKTISGSPVRPTGAVIIFLVLV
jgi:hypothetical protein